MMQQKRKKKEYESPFVAGAREKALLRAREQQKRKKQQEKQRELRAMQQREEDRGWDADCWGAIRENKGLFDPQLKKVEIFQVLPRGQRRKEEEVDTTRVDAARRTQRGESSQRAQYSSTDHRSLGNKHASVRKSESHALPTRRSAWAVSSQSEQQEIDDNNISTTLVHQGPASGVTSDDHSHNEDRHMRGPDSVSFELSNSCLDDKHNETVPVEVGCQRQAECGVNTDVEYVSRGCQDIPAQGSHISQSSNLMPKKSFSCKNRGRIECVDRGTSPMRRKAIHALLGERRASQPPFVGSSPRKANGNVASSASNRLFDNADSGLKQALSQVLKSNEKNQKMQAETMMRIFENLTMTLSSNNFGKERPHNCDCPAEGHLQHTSKLASSRKGGSARKKGQRAQLQRSIVDELSHKLTVLDQKEKQLLDALVESQNQNKAIHEDLTSENIPSSFVSLPDSNRGRVEGTTHNEMVKAPSSAETFELSSVGREFCWDSSRAESTEHSVIETDGLCNLSHHVVKQDGCRVWKCSPVVKSEVTQYRDELMRANNARNIPFKNKCRGLTATEVADRLTQTIISNILSDVDQELEMLLTNIAANVMVKI